MKGFSEPVACLEPVDALDASDVTEVQRLSTRASTRLSSRMPLQRSSTNTSTLSVTSAASGEAVEDAEASVGSGGDGGDDADAALFGREAEVAVLETAVDGLVDGSMGCVVVLRGETGVGKSALLLRLMATARERGVELVVDALEEAHRDSPFGVFMQLLPKLMPPDYLDDLAAHYLDLSDHYMQVAAVTGSPTAGSMKCTTLVCSTQVHAVVLRAVACRAGHVEHVTRHRLICPTLPRSRR